MSRCSPTDIDASELLDLRAIYSRQIHEWSLAREREATIQLLSEAAAELKSKRKKKPKPVVIRADAYATPAARLAGQRAAQQAGLRALRHKEYR